MTSLRVITVGAHEAAQSLRRDPQVELVRSEDPLDAVGELARPMEEPPRDTAVLVESARLPESEAAAFVAAARSASPDVTLLTVGEQVDGFDGVWSEADDPEPTATEPEAPSHAPVSAPEPDETDDEDALAAHLELFLRGRCV